jgi:hypothetical protein
MADGGQIPKGRLPASRIPFFVFMGTKADQDRSITARILNPVNRSAISERGDDSGPVSR